MTLLKRTLAWLAVLALLALPAAAQFVDQRTWGGTSGGSGNAQTITIPNWSTNLPGVPLRFIAGFTNTGATTLAVSGLSPLAINKQTPTGLQALSGGEIQAGQVYQVVPDGTVYQLVNATAVVSVVARTSATTVSTNADCGKFFSLGGGTFYTFTINAGTFATGCTIQVYDADGGRGKGLSIAGTLVRLFPGQSYTYTYSGTGWIQSPKSQLWQTPGTIYVNHASGSDAILTSDCLATGAGACSTFQNGVNILQNFTYPQVGGTTIQADCEATYTQAALGAANSIQVYRGLGGIINFIGNAGTPTNCAIIPNVATTIFDVQDVQQATITGFELGYSAGFGTAVSGRQIVILDVNNSYFATNTGNYHVTANDLASVNLVNNTVNGGAAGLLNASTGASTVVAGTLTVPAAGAANLTNWYVASGAAQITGGPTYVILGTVSGAKYACSTNAVINFSVSYPAGLTAGSASSGCQASPP